MINAHKSLFVFTVYCLMIRYQCITCIINRILHTNQSALDKICTNDNSNYTYSELNEIYSTANSYISTNYQNSNDDDKYSKQFYLELINTGKMSDLTQFLNGGTIGYVFVFGVAFGVLATWLIFGILWCCNCCLFIKEHDTTKCRLAPYIVITTLFGLTFVLLIISLVFSTLARKDFNKAVCSLLKLSFEGVNGKGNKAVIPEWSGTNKVKASLEETKLIIDNFASNYTSSFLLFNQIVANAKDFEDSVISYETNYGKLKILSPNFDSTNRILPIFLTSYSPVTSPDKTLYKILNEYLANIKPSVNILIQIENNGKQVSTLSTQMKSEIDKAILEIENIGLALKVIDEKLTSSFLLIHDLLTNIIFVLYDVSSSLIVVIAGAIIIFTSLFKFKLIMCIKHLLHVLWNINFFFLFVSFVVCAFFGLLSIISHNIIVTVNYMFDPLYMGHSNSIFSFQQSTVNHINTCLNSDGKLHKSINVNRVFYDYLDFVYLSTFSLYELHNQIASLTQSMIIPTENEIYIKYQKNTPISTDDSYAIDDVTKALYQLSRWTDTGLPDSHQDSCSFRTYDHWVANVNQCPNGYLYSPTGQNPKNCLLIPNWTKLDITLRYNSACDTVDRFPIVTGARNYFDRLLDYYTSCDNLLNSILSGNRDFANKYEVLLKDIKQETQNIKPLLDHLKSVYEPIVGINTIYEIYNCSALKNELVLFYDQLSNLFYTKCLVIVIMTLLSLSLSYSGNYFFIDVIYRHEDVMINDKGGSSRIGSKNEGQQEESEGTPEYDDHRASSAQGVEASINYRNYLPVHEKKEKEEFENNPMYNILSGDKKNTVEIKSEKIIESEGAQNNMLRLSDNKSSHRHRKEINNQFKENQNNNLI